MKKATVFSGFCFFFQYLKMIWRVGRNHLLHLGDNSVIVFQFDQLLHLLLQHLRVFLRQYCLAYLDVVCHYRAFFRGQQFFKEFFPRSQARKPDLDILFRYIPRGHGAVRRQVFRRRAAHLGGRPARPRHRPAPIDTGLRPRGPGTAPVAIRNLI